MQNCEGRRGTYTDVIVLSIALAKPTDMDKHNVGTYIPSSSSVSLDFSASNHDHSNNITASIMH